MNKPSEKNKPQYTKNPRKCKIAIFDGKFVLTGDAMYTAVKATPNAKKAIITVTLVKNI